MISSRTTGCALTLALSFMPLSAHAATNTEKADIEALRQEIDAMRKAMESQQRQYELEITRLKAKIDRLSETTQEPGASTRTSEMAAPGASTSGDRPQGSRVAGMIQDMNPDISAIIDTYYHNNDLDGGIDRVGEEIAGFGHSHGGGDAHEHSHSHIEEGFNMRHLEIMLSGEVDPYFKAHAIAAVSEEGSEMEEAVIETTALPFGFAIKAGKFFSDFGRINPQHSHEWDFVDQPLIYKLTLGEHGLNEKGVQLSWLAPTPFHLLFGAEALQGENEMLFNHIGDDPLPAKDGPRLGVGWIKFAPDLPGNHGLQAGVSAGYGVHQEAHDGTGDGSDDHWLDGHSRFWNLDCVYKYDTAGPYGQGDLILQGEYFRRDKDLDVARHDINPLLNGMDREDRQDGYYVQAVYGFLPRWRGGLRWEQVGLLNEQDLPTGKTNEFDDSSRLSGVIDFNPTEFSRLRLQLNRGDYAFLDGDKEKAWEAFVQLMISLGTHGAHKF